MSHGSETRKQRGGKTGVGGRRSREGAGLGESLRASKSLNPFDLKDSVKQKIQATEQMWNNVSHEWFGTSKKTFPYNMNKWKPKAPSLINSGDFKPVYHKPKTSMPEAGHLIMQKPNPIMNKKLPYKGVS